MIKITYQTIVLVRKRMKRRVCLKADEKCLNEGSSWTVKLAFFCTQVSAQKRCTKICFFVQKLTFRAQKRWPWTNQELIDLVRYKMRCKMDCKWGVIQDWVYIDIYARTFNGQVRWDICTLNRVDRYFFFTQTSWLTKWWSAGFWLLKFRWLVLSASFLSMTSFFVWLKSLIFPLDLRHADSSERFLRFLRFKHLKHPKKSAVHDWGIWWTNISSQWLPSTTCTTLNPNGNVSYPTCLQGLMISCTP